MKLSVGRVLVVLLVCGAIVPGGCGKRLSVGPCLPVQGNVTLGGQPLVGGQVMFIPLNVEGERPRPEGVIDAQGHYSLKTVGKEGAPAGEYRAIITTSGQDKNQDSRFDPTYSHWEKSPLEVRVAENSPPGTYDLKLRPLTKR
jgi:hypothetical protein